MADEMNSRDSSGKSKKHSESERVGKGNEGNNEWLRDQVGEDHNLSGSSTYRTLPDQPEPSSDDDSDDNDLKRKSSKR
jgi:hypothetical protein